MDANAQSLTLMPTPLAANAHLAGATGVAQVDAPGGMVAFTVALPHESGLAGLVETVRLDALEVTGRVALIVDHEDEGRTGRAEVGREPLPRGRVDQVVVKGERDEGVGDRCRARPASERDPDRLVVVFAGRRVAGS